MAKLKNILPHMVGGTIKVNGQTYQLDAAGTVEIDDPVAVDRLLQNKAAWRPVVLQMQVTTQKSEKPKPVEKRPVRKPIAEVIVETKKPTKKKQTEDTEDEWPDPSPQMSIGYLRDMADAYGVRYVPKTKKGELVQKIHDAMYEPE